MCLQYLIFVQNHSIFPGNSLHNFSIFYMPKKVLRIYNNPANFGHYRALILYMYNLHIFCPQKGDFRPVEAVFCISGLKKIVYVQTDCGSLDFHRSMRACQFLPGSGKSPWGPPPLCSDKKHSILYHFLAFLSEMK